MFCPSLPAREDSHSDEEDKQTSILSYGTVYKRDVLGLLPLAARSNKPAVSRKSAPQADSCSAAAAPKKRAAHAARGIGKWVTVSLVVGELKGDEGRTARDRAMLRGDIVEPASYVKLMLGYQEKGAEWIEKRLAGECNPKEGPLAKRGEDGKTKYIKLSADEKQTAVQMYDQMVADGWSSRQAIAHMQSSIDRFRNVSPSSISGWRKAAAAEGNNGEQAGEEQKRKAGSPPVVPPDVRQAIKDKVCACCLILIALILTAAERSTLSCCRISIPPSA